MTEFLPEAYQGRWYEIARYESPFERDCGGATADYVLEGNTFLVINTCYDDGGPLRQTIGRLDLGTKMVKFNYQLILANPLKGNFIDTPPGLYQILWTDYNNWSFVGSENYYWILSRKKRITQEDFRFILDMTRRFGYDPKRVTTHQSPI